MQPNASATHNALPSPLFSVANTPQGNPPQRGDFGLSLEQSIQNAQRTNQPPEKHPERPRLPETSRNNTPARQTEQQRVTRQQNQTTSQSDHSATTTSNTQPKTDRLDESDDTETPNAEREAQPGQTAIIAVDESNDTAKIAVAANLFSVPMVATVDEAAIPITSKNMGSELKALQTAGYPGQSAADETDETSIPEANLSANTPDKTDTPLKGSANFSSALTAANKTDETSIPEADLSADTPDKTDTPLKGNANFSSVLTGTTKPGNNPASLASLSAQISTTDTTQALQSPQPEGTAAHTALQPGASLINLNTPHAYTARTDTPTVMQLSTPAGQKTWPDDIANRVMWLAGRGEGRAELVLTPPNLGKLGISIQMNGDTATAHFVTATSAARDALEQAMPRLREALQQAGIAMGDTSVSTSSQQQQSGNNGYKSSPTQSRSGEGEYAMLPDVSSEAQKGRFVQVGAGLVDIFA